MGTGILILHAGSGTAFSSFNLPEQRGVFIQRPDKNTKIGSTSIR